MSCFLVSQRARNVGLREVVPDKEWWLISKASKRVDKTVTVVQAGGVAAALAEPSIGVAGDLDLRFGHRLDSSSYKRSP